MALNLLVPHPPPSPYPLLALDLSTVAVGWAWLGMADASPICDSARPEDVTTLAARLHWLGAWTYRQLCGPPPLRPGLVIVECPDLSARTGQGMTTTPETLKALWEAAGVIRECCRRVAVPMVEVDARRVRDRVCGRASASKEELQQALVRRGFVLPTRGATVDHDAADALGLLISVADELAMMSHTVKGVAR